MNQTSIDLKTADAQKILGRCLGRHGVWADSTRYRYQCWTRDFVLATMPVLLQMGKFEIVKTHLENLSKRQRTNGQIPILFLDRALPFVVDKLKRSWRGKQLSFMLKRFLSGQLWNLTTGTRDSEILYIIGMYEYAQQTGDYSLLEKYEYNIGRALAYIESNLMYRGIVSGCDWRDTMEKKLGDKPLLSNNCLMCHAYDLLGYTEKAEHLRLLVNQKFWYKNSYIDYPGNNRFDPLGVSLAILYDIAPPEYYDRLILQFLSIDTPYGVTIKCRHNPLDTQEQEIIERTNGVVVWPFIVGFSILAMLKMNEPLVAKDQFKKMISASGFREWYDPATGQGCGAQEQLWSAVLFLRAAKAIEDNSFLAKNCAEIH